MKTFTYYSALVAAFAFVTSVCVSCAPGSSSYARGGPPSLRVFSSSFAEPPPPIVAAEFRCNWNQHKWNQNISNIASGFLYNSPSNLKVRVDEAYDTTLASSLFDFSNVTSNGLVLNSVYSITPSIASKPSCQQYLANSNFPLVPADFLTSQGAVFGGLREDDFNGLVSEWDILYQGAIPVTVLVNQSNVVVGYEYFAPDLRTRVITTFFNIIVGKIDANVFAFPACSKP